MQSSMSSCRLLHSNLVRFTPTSNLFSNHLHLTSSSKPFSKLHFRFNSQISLLNLEQKRPIAPSLLHCGISSNNISSNNQKTLREWIESIGETLSAAFPLWVSLACVLALLKPNSFNWVTPNWTILGISLTMLGMGMTLTFDDLRAAFAMPKELFAGFLLQYSLELA